MKVTSIYRKDKVGTLTHGSGNINMASSILTIGGLQYDTEGARSVALPTMTANTRYQIYAVVSGGDVILVVSQNENSAGPTGYASWKLVGSIYSNGLASVGFGSFINIVDTPETGWIPFDTTGTWTANTTYFGRWKRNGANLEMQFRVATSGAPTAASLVINLPTNLSVDTLTNQLSNNSGYGYAQDSGNANYDLGVLIVTASSIAPVSKGAAGTFVNNANTTNTTPFTWGNTDILDCYSTVAAVGFNNIAIEDL